MNMYTGSCHCGAVKFSVNADIDKAIECNCSHCARKGFLLAFVPESAMTIESGEDNLAEYRFNKKHIAHLFCKTCGVQAFGKGARPDGTATYAINVRTIPDLDLETITIEKVDGKSY